MAFEKVKTVEDLFNELDQSKFYEVAKPLADYRNELMKNGFTRREAMRLVETYSKFTYDLMIESMISDRHSSEIDDLEAEALAEDDIAGFDDDEPGEYAD